MSLSRKQLIKNSVWTFLELALYPLLMIAATPLFIKKLGIEQYGLWMLITNIALGINMLNIGVGDTNIRLISKYRAQGELSVIRKVFRYNFSFSLFLCFCAVLVGIIFFASDFITIFYKNPDYGLANTLLLLACVSTGIKFVETGILSVFKGFERFDINSKLTLLSRNSVMLINLALVLLNYKLTELLVFTILVNLLNVLIQLRILYVFDKQLVEFPSLTFFRERLDQLNYNFWYWLQSGIGLLGYLADKLVVAYFTDVKTLGYYSIASLVGTQIHNFFMAFGSFIFPRVSYKLALNDGVRPIYFVARGLVAIPGWVLTALLILSGDIVFRLWLGTETYLNSIVFIKLYLVYISGLLLNIVPFYFINGTSHVKLNSLFEATIRTSHLVFMITGYFLMGVEGIIYGLILSTTLNIPFQYLLFHKKVLGDVHPVQSLLVYLPVFFIMGLAVSGTVFFKLSLILGLVISCKLIYFNTAQDHSKSISIFASFFTKRQGK